MRDMVDNENQWEDMEYSDEAGASGDYSDESYEDDDYSEQDYESYDDDDEGGGHAQPAKVNLGGCLVVLILLAAIIAGVVFYLLPKFKGESGSMNNAPQQNEQLSFGPEMNQGGQQSMEQNSSDMGDMFFNEAGGESTEMMSVDFNGSGQANVTTTNGNEEIVATVSEQQMPPQENTSSDSDLFSQGSDLSLDPNQGSNEIMVAYNKSARENPFKPPIVEAAKGGVVDMDGPFEIIEPPVQSVADDNLTRLLQTQISGILYDEESPSAIVNLNGMDQFVKAGDTISGYTIDYITKDKVQISYQNNSYVASVGALFTRGSLEKQPAVADLENKFAGRYRNK